VCVCVCVCVCVWVCVSEHVASIVFWGGAEQASSTSPALCAKTRLQPSICASKKTGAAHPFSPVEARYWRAICRMQRSGSTLGSTRRPHWTWQDRALQQQQRQQHAPALTGTPAAQGTWCARSSLPACSMWEGGVLLLWGACMRCAPACVSFRRASTRACMCGTWEQRAKARHYHLAIRVREPSECSVQVHSCLFCLQPKLLRRMRPCARTPARPVCVSCCAAAHVVARQGCCRCCLPSRAEQTRWGPRVKHCQTK